MIRETVRMMQRQNPVYSPLERLSRRERRGLMNGVGQEISLSHLQYALCVDGGLGAQAEDALVTSELSFRVQLAACVSNQWMEKEDCIEQCLEGTDVVISTLHVNQFVLKD